MMEDGEATQDPTAPEGAPASPLAEASSESQAAPETEAGAEGETESAIPPAEAPVAAIDWSHLRGFQTVESPPEALAAREDYAEEHGKELAARAARFARSVDESIVLSSEGVLRWLGDPVARVVAGDQLLQPRAVLLADEALSGEDRAAVETRVALWLAAHVRKVLGPLLSLAEGAELSEAARALGGKIAEALGVLDRDRVRTEVKALDQTARGALRKLGVRFGSLYIYVPALLKPAARGLCSLLWTLRRGSEAGADRLLAFAAAGRTSFANEGLLSPDSYRVAGFRLSGERVVRVDIIERLSDLIRAAIPDHMRFGSRPTADTYGFLITPQMTSLTGCSGEAFASILRSLGFEPVKVSRAAFEAANRKAPTEPIKPAPVEASPSVAEETEAPAGDAAAAPVEEAPAVASSEPIAEDEPVAEIVAEPPPDEEPILSEPTEERPSVAASSEPVAAESEAANESHAADEAEAVPAAEAEAEIANSVDSEVETPELAASSDAVEVAAQDEEIEIWRPAPRRSRAPQRPQGEEREARAPRQGRPQREHRRAAQPAEAAKAPEAAAAEATPRPHGPPRGQRPERRDDAPRWREAKDERPRDDRRPSKDFGPRREARPVDPDSPFAKLAALKPLLERRDKRP